uniref:lysozyme n=1 Tax=Plectus sambesii TaxID=2011161 RepID=A0A914VXS9_9BILA
MQHASLLLLLPSLAGALLMFPQVEFRDECMKAMCEEDSGCLPEGCTPDSAGRLGCGYFKLNIYQYKVCVCVI